MDISSVLKQLKKLQINGVSDDTRYLEPNDAFVCRQGKNYRGSDFIIEAVLKGAKAIISEIPMETVVVPVILCDNIEKHFEGILTAVYGSPWENINLIGVTGTDGKTTTASIIEHLINQVYSCGYIGTNGIRYADISRPSKYTTLPLCLLIKTLQKMKQKNIVYCALEISSQGLIDNRLEPMEFSIAVFTNLTHEHLDTHKTMENYFQAKIKLFKKLKPDGLAIVNIDSPYGYRITHPRLVTYGIDNICDWQALNIKGYKNYTVFDLKTPNGIIKNLKINMTGKYNIYNSIAAIISAAESKVPFSKIVKAISNIPKIPGRMELLTKNENFKVYVDFAHTPNALRAVLTSISDAKNRVTVVLGAAGNKDKTKRPEMGEIACTNADYVIFTSEDPRNEDPLDIIKEMISTTDKKNYEIIINRKKAIREAIFRAQANDIIIITGKGNDEYFEQNNRIYIYSDIIEATNALKERKN
ncbi:MAG: UDP-N-acetylmuramoyl-L-alanyl-D-glutamate--2,6-diaminopimelate ligase [Bacilli bacterium]|nr:UDP-N-acetylmuramoyl-L-alanyl-D-glutamate--2,6-diaminopimelate ligase [Bacilli bacterium]MDD4076410.1 UDP-N-acetylmuramoyl-L-alanyl-D-glutamate--2,6-diaminopimelate ligase [Bacilli bacterium]